MTDGTLSRNTWKRFVQEGVLDSARIDKRVSESWWRCKHKLVDPYSGQGREILAAESLLRRKEKHQLLLELTMPHVNRMLPFLEESGMIALLIDPDGYVLAMRGEKTAIQRAKQINFIEGVRWTEEEVGTNAIGTALHALEPIAIVGPEHYALASHNWSCSAAPIRDEAGNLLGVLDLSCPIERNQANMLAVVTSIAYAVEQEWARHHQQDELELIHQFVEQLESDKPLLLCNQWDKVVLASKPIRRSTADWSSINVKQAHQYGWTVLGSVPVYSRRHGRVIGFVKHLHPTDKRLRPPVQVISSPPAVTFPGEIGCSSSFRLVLQEIRRVAKTGVHVFISGESGSGKELVARAIHDNSVYHKGPYVAVNCGAIPRELIESELFGYAEGAFTGSRRHGYQGKLQQANGGTLFLDEIGEIPYPMQVALLRVLQERKVTPIGSNKEIPLHFRVIAATNRNIYQLVREGKFREDLFYRLHVYPLRVPPLRERKEDIPYLIRYYCQKNNWQLPLTDEHIQILMKYHWPGNIRQLFNTLERLQIVGEAEIPAVLSQLAEECSTEDEISPPLSGSQSELLHPASGQPLSYREHLERQTIIQALQQSQGKAAAAARLLGVPRSTFYRKLRKYRL